MKKTFLFIMLIIFCAFGSLIACDGSGKDVHEHVYGDWIVEFEPTCVSEGQKKVVCKICGEPLIKPIEKLGHDYDDVPIVIKEATCDEEGEVHYTCKNGCGVPKIEILPRTEHDYSGEETVKPATCTEKGERRIKCIHCGKEKVTVLSSLGHEYDEGTVETQPTCETDGVKLFKCIRCKDEKSEKINKLGHEYGGFVVDKPSSTTEDGQKSRHCTREGCNSVKDQTVITKGETMEYSLSVKRGNGEDYPFLDEISVSVGDTTINDIKFEGGKATFTAKADGNLSVSLSGLRQGYAQKTNVTLGRNKVEYDIVVEGSIVDSSAAPTKPLEQSEAMYDFTVTDSNKNVTSKFSELMKGKKGAYIFFFYIGCGNCATQFPVFVTEYNKHANKSDVLVVMVNIYAGNVRGQTAADMLGYKQSKNYPDEFYMMSGVSNNFDLFDWVSRPYNGVPFSYFIDGEGVIDEIVLANSTANLRKTYSRVLNEYLGEPQSDASTTSFDNMGRENFVETASLAAYNEFGEPNSTEHNFAGQGELQGEFGEKASYEFAEANHVETNFAEKTNFAVQRPCEKVLFDAGRQKRQYNFRQKVEKVSYGK